jgi:glycosyltransferase involved in cell wall biosynthesis
MISSALLLVKQFYGGGGQATYNHHLANFLSSQGVKVHVVTFDNNSGTDSWDNITVHKKRLEINANNFFSWTMLVNMKLKEASREIWDSQGFDLIHCNDWEVFPAAAMMKKLTGKPLVLTLHSTESLRGNSSLFSGMVNDFENMAITDSDIILVNNQHTFDQLGENKSKTMLIDPISVNWQSQVLQAYSKVVE